VADDGSLVTGSGWFFPDLNRLTAVSVNPATAQILAHIDNSGNMLFGSPLYGTGVTLALTTPIGVEKIIFSPDGALAYGAYTNSADGTHGIDVCSVAPDGTLSNCVTTGANTGNSALVEKISSNHLYAFNATGGLDVCPINSDGSLGTCQNTAVTEHPLGLELTSRFAYLTTGGSTIRRCTLNADGTMGACVDLTDPSFNGTRGIARK
jgi:hypothetical protein